MEEEPLFKTKMGNEDMKEFLGVRAEGFSE
jgi:hypothetical protein